MIQLAFIIAATHITVAARTDGLTFVGNLLGAIIWVLAGTARWIALKKGVVQDGW